MKSILKSLIILFIYILPVNAACDFLVDIGEKGGKLFDKYGPPFPDFPGSFIMPSIGSEICPNDNLSEAIAIEYMFLGEKPEDSVLAGIKMSYYSGLIFGAITTLAPLLVFMPFTGQGILAKNTDQPTKTSFIFLIRHSIYGVAMYEGFRWFLI